MSQTRPHSVLFVCMGNICRSPTGEGLFRALVEERGLEEHFRIDSAGTIAYHSGNPPDRRMRAAASRRGYELEGRARQIEVADLDLFGLIIAMDRENLHDILAMDPLAQQRRQEGRLKLLSEFLDSGPLDGGPLDGGPLDGGPEDVPDPYYGGEAGFMTVIDMIEAACPQILEHLLTPDQLPMLHDK